MTTKNDITGDSLISKIPNDAYRENWERIFGSKNGKDKQLQED